MQSAETTAPDVAATGAAPRRKHRQGLHRTQVACERCRARKNKCDGKAPACTTCEKAGAECTVVDRLTYRQFPRGHVENLETRVQTLQEENNDLRAQIRLLQQSQQQSFDTPVGSAAKSQATVGPASACGGELAVEFGLLSLEGTSERKYVGESSGVHFGKIVGTILPREAQALPLIAQLANPLKGGFGIEHRAEATSTASWSSIHHEPANIPTDEVANRLQESFFSHRWSSLPFLHRPTFLKDHYQVVLQSGTQADGASLFLAYMVFAIGAIDLRRKNGNLSVTPLDYFNTATSLYLSGLVERGNLETIQGLLLLSTFAINEPQILNAWMVSGLAMRLAIELGLHRNVGSEFTLFRSEMRKRVFWAAYVLDRNISITLGRPLSIQDKDINVELPLPLSDDALVMEDISPGSSQCSSPTPSDLSTFIHIIKLRQLGSRIQGTFYPTNLEGVDPQLVLAQRDNMRTELENWIGSAPRYTLPTAAVFQSVEWFQIAYYHALLLLYRPSPACPEATVQALQTCADASITLITLYLTLYNKNKFAYTWVSLHSLFMASVTMLYTLTRREIRTTTTKNITKSNLDSSLNLFKNMAELWPEAARRCHQVVERLGGFILALFDNRNHPEENSQRAAHLNSTQGASFGEMIQDSLDWFGSRQRSGISSPLPETSGFDSEPQFDSARYQILGSSSLGMDYNLDEMMDLDGWLEFGFDLSLPLMTDVFDSSDMLRQDLQDFR